MLKPSAESEAGNARSRSRRSSAGRDRHARCRWTIPMPRSPRTRGADGRAAGRDPRAHEVLRARRPGHSRARRHQPRHPRGRLRRADGTVGVGQVDAAQSHRRHRQADVGPDSRRGRRHRAALGSGPRRVARGERRLHLPVLQPDARAVGVRQRRAAASAHVAVAARSARARRNRARARGPRRPDGALPERALRRPAAARGDRPGADRRSGARSSPTSPPATSIARRPRRSCISSSVSTAKSARRSSW